MTKQRFILLSPVLVILLGTVTIRLAQRSLGVWAWVPWILVYWASIGFLAYWGSEPEALKRWLDRPKGTWLWSALAILLAVPSAFMFLSAWQVLKPLAVWLPWLIVGLVNPVLEEGYWRGLLLDRTSVWPGWVSVLATSLLFALNHLLGIGVTSLGGRHPVLLINAFVFGLVFGLIYRRTKSLRWLVIAHAMTDLFGLSVPVFLNLWIPPT